MDILKPTAAAVPHRDLTAARAALETAEKNLGDFKRLSKDVTTEAAGLVKFAKHLVQEVIYNNEQYRKKLAANDWTNADVRNARMALHDKQEKPWATLHEQADGLKTKIEGSHKVLLASKEAVVRARGDGITAALFGALTADQKEVRKVYDHQLKSQFQEADEAYAAVAVYPDGMLPQIAAFHKKAAELLQAEAKEQAK